MCPSRIAGPTLDPYKENLFLFAQVRDMIRLFALSFLPSVSSFAGTQEGYYKFFPFNIGRGQDGNFSVKRRSDGMHYESFRSKDMCTSVQLSMSIAFDDYVTLPRTAAHMIR